MVHLLQRKFGAVFQQEHFSTLKLSMLPTSIFCIVLAGIDSRFKTKSDYMKYNCASRVRGYLKEVTDKGNGWLYSFVKQGHFYLSAS